MPNSLASYQLPTQEFEFLNFDNLIKNKLSGESLANAYTQNSLNSRLDANGNPLNLNGGEQGFFTAGNSTMQNIGEGLGLAAGAVSLADMLNNWGVGKKAMKLNMANLRQQMGQSKEAFERDKARQDGTAAAIDNSNRIAQEFYRNGG